MTNDVTNVDQVTESDVVVKNRQGIHLRNAAVLVQTASKFPDAEFVIARDGDEVNGKSIMGVLTLVAEQGATLRLRARGGQAAELIAAMEEMFASEFGEENE